MRNYFLILLLLLVAFGCKPKKQYDKIIRNGLIYDGKGGNPYKADIAINADTIAAIGDLQDAVGKDETDAHGLAVAPRFYQYAEPGTGKPDSRRPLAKRYQAGRNPRSDGRRQQQWVRLTQK